MSGIKHAAACALARVTDTIINVKKNFGLCIMDNIIRSYTALPLKEYDRNKIIGKSPISRTSSIMKLFYIKQLCSFTEEL